MYIPIHSFSTASTPASLDVKSGCFFASQKNDAYYGQMDAIVCARMGMILWVVIPLYIIWEVVLFSNFKKY